MKLSIKAMAIAGAIVGGLGLFLATWWIILMDGPHDGPVFLSKIYRWYSISPLGSFIGCLWGAVDGAAGGAGFAWIYNQFVPSKQNGNGGEA